MSDYNYIYGLIKQGEGLTLDFKQRISSEAKIARSLVSFANSKGGKLLVGVDDRGEITGVDASQEKHTLIKAARLYCDPAIYLHFKELRVKRKIVLEVVVDKRAKIEHRAKDEAGRWFPFVRVEDQSVLAPGFDLEEQSMDPIPILMEQNQGLINYLNKFEAISIKEYMQMMNISYGIANRSLDELEGYGVLEKEDRGGRMWYFLAEEESY